MAHRKHGNAFNDAMELLIENGFDGMADVLKILLNEAMKIEREDCLSAGSYQRTPDRKGYANGFKPRTVDTRMGRITVDVPQVRGDVEFYPSALENAMHKHAICAPPIGWYYHGILWFVPMPGPRKTAFRNNRSIAGYQPRYVGFEAKRITCPRPWRSTVAKDELASRCLASGHSRPLSRKSSSSTSRTGVSVGYIDIITVSPPTMTGKNLPSPKPSQ
jgi:hypothetical protein